MTGDPMDLPDRLHRSPGVTELRPPTPGSSQTPAGTSVPERLWYVSYGSNLLRARFLTYLLGGRADGLDRSYPTTDDPRPPVAEAALLLPGSIRFAREAASWGGGGVAFWDPDHGGGTPARGWLVTLRQFEELLHLENGGLHRRRTAVPQQLWSTGGCDVAGDGWYSRLVLLGQLDGAPAVTFTATAGDMSVANPPGSAYAGVVARGIAETFGDPARGGVTQDVAVAFVAWRAGAVPTAAQVLG